MASDYIPKRRCLTLRRSEKTVLRNGNYVDRDRYQLDHTTIVSLPPSSLSVRASGDLVRSGRGVDRQSILLPLLLLSAPNATHSV
jgi:hypothetical protein